MHGLRAYVERELRLTGRQRIHKIGEELRGNGDRALVLDARRDPHVDPDLQVGRGQLDAPVLGPQEDIGQDRQASTRRDGTSRDLESSGEVLHKTNDLHAPSPSFSKIFLYAVVTRSSGVDYASSNIRVSSSCTPAAAPRARPSAAHALSRCGYPADGAGR